MTLGILLMSSCRQQWRTLFQFFHNKLWRNLSVFLELDVNYEKGQVAISPPDKVKEEPTQEIWAPSHTSLSR